VKAIDADHRRITVHCDDGAIFEAAAAILTVPLPVLRKSRCLRRRARRAAASTDIGFGNVVKIPLRFATRWWADHRG
jgi:monoamine oxidase